MSFSFGLFGLEPPRDFALAKSDAGGSRSAVQPEKRAAFFWQASGGAKRSEAIVLSLFLFAFVLLDSSA